MPVLELLSTPQRASSPGPTTLPMTMRTRAAGTAGRAALVASLALALTARGQDAVPRL